MTAHGLLTAALAIGVFGVLNTEMGMIGMIPYIPDAYGVSLAEAGLLVSLFALAVALSGPVMPLLFSRFEKKKIMLAVLAVFTAGNGIAAAADSFPVLLAARVVPAFFHPLFCAFAFSAAAESVEPSQAPDAVGKVMIGTSSGMVVGVPVAHLLADTFGVSAAFLFFTLVTALAFAAVQLFVPSMPPKGRMSLESQLALLKTPLLWKSIAAVMGMNGAVFGVFSYMAGYLTDVSLFSPEAAGLILFLFGIANIEGSYLSGAVLIRFGEKGVALYPFLLTLLYILLMLFAKAPAAVVILTAFWGVMGGVNANMNQYWIATAMPGAESFASGLFLTAANLGTMLGTSLSGWLIASAGMVSVPLSGIFFALLSAAFIFLRTGVHPVSGRAVLGASRKEETLEKGSS